MIILAYCRFSDLYRRLFRVEEGRVAVAVILRSPDRRFSGFGVREEAL